MTVNFGDVGLVEARSIVNALYIFGVSVIAVIALAVVLEDQLPVRRNRVADRVGELGVREALMLHLRGNFGGTFVEGNGVTSEANK